MALPPSPDLPRRGAHRKHGQETEGARRRLHGKVAMVAGGLSGIGAANAGRIAAEVRG